MSMRVSLAPARHHGVGSSTDGASLPLLDPKGARIIIGRPVHSAVMAEPIAPAARTLFGPRGAALAAAQGPLVVCDTGHHRLMIWAKTPAVDAAPADLLIGQSDFASEGRNGKMEPSAATLNVPTGVAIDSGILVVADAWNHRVLLWHGVPNRSNQPADVVIGHRDFRSTAANRGCDKPGADTLNWCYGVAVQDGRLYVADTGNRRVLVWNEVPQHHGAPADLVLGQHEFTTRDEAGGMADPAAGMRWPHAIAVAGDRLFVVDAGHSRVLVWNRPPKTNGQRCDLVLGQPDLRSRDHNGGRYEPTAATMNMPYGICMAADQLIVADTANSRLLGFDLAALELGRSATRLAGQSTFAERGENRWQQPGRDTLCWPYGAAARGATVAIADSGNNRVLLWDVL
jgi:sugar lactone lactonase YvrE